MTPAGTSGWSRAPVAHASFPGDQAPRATGCRRRRRAADTAAGTRRRRRRPWWFRSCLRRRARAGGARGRARARPWRPSAAMPRESPCTTTARARGSASTQGAKRGAKSKTAGRQAAGARRRTRAARGTRQVRWHCSRKWAPRRTGGTGARPSTTRRPGAQTPCARPPTARRRSADRPRCGSGCCRCAQRGRRGWRWPRRKSAGGTCFRRAGARRIPPGGSASRTYTARL